MGDIANTEQLRIRRYGLVSLFQFNAFDAKAQLNAYKSNADASLIIRPAIRVAVNRAHIN